MNLLNKIKTRYRDYKAYNKKHKDITAAYKQARSRIFLLLTFIKRELRVEESQTCLEMEVLIFDALAQSFLEFIDNMSYEPKHVGVVIYSVMKSQTRLKEIVAPYLLQ